MTTALVQRLQVLLRFFRSSFRLNRNTGEIQSKDGPDDDNGDYPDAKWGRCSHFQNPYYLISHFAFSFAQRVGPFVSSVAPSLWPTPTDEDLGRQAECDRKRSRHAMLNISYTTPNSQARFSSFAVHAPNREPLPLPARQRNLLMVERC